MADPTPDQIRALLTDRRLRQHAWNAFEKSSRRTTLRIACTPATRKDTPMPQTVTLPLDPTKLADLLLAPAADANTLHRQLAAQIGGQTARRVLAEAHSIAADRLWNS